MVNIDLDELNITSELKKKIRSWIQQYADIHYSGFSNLSLIDKLDFEGKEIAIIVKNQIPEAKILYYSAAKMTKEIIK